MSLTATNAQVYKGTAAVTYGSGSGVSNRELQGTATITYGGAPTSNTALSLPGTSGNYMNLGSTNPANIDTSVSNVFVEAWFYAFSYPSNTTFIIYKGGNNINSEDFGLWVSGLYGVNWRMWNTAGAGFAGVTGSNNLNVNQWYHVAGSWDVGTKTLYTFLNGTLLGPGTLTGTPRYSASSRVQIGAANSAGFLGDYYPFNGYIRDVRIVQGGIVPKTSFTPTGVPFRLNLPPYMSGGSTVLSLYEQYFTPSWLALPGTSGNFMNLGATHPSNFDTSASNLFCEAWIYVNSFQTVATSIIGRHNTIASPGEDWMLWINGSRQPQFRVTSTGNASQDGSLATVMNTGQWYHMAGSWDNTNKRIYVFLNGTASAATNFSGTARFNSTWAPQIGIYTGGQYVNGYVQDVRVTRGGIVPTTSFTPSAAPFGLASPSYVTSGTTVLSLATQYYQTGMTIKTNNSPDIYLAPTGSYPSFNSPGGTAPSFLSDRVRFNPGAVSETSSSCQFVDFGAQTFPMTTSGFSFACKFQFTGSPGFFERIFCINQENVNPSVLFKRNTDSNILLYGYYNPSQQVLADFGSYAQNTTYTVIGVYNPNVGTYGTLYLYKNGTLGASYTATSKLANFTSSNVFVGSGRTYSGDGALNADIFYLAMYKRVLSASEIATVTASGPSFGPTPIQFTNRTPLTPVLTNPGTLQLTIGQVVTISQTAPQPANGITWTFAPVGTGLNLTSTTDYAMTLTAASGVTSSLFTVTATNRAGLTTVIQFVAGGDLYSMTFPFTFTNMSTTGANGPTSITYGASNPGFGTGYAMVLGTGTSAGMQRWTVPASGSYTFTVAGAGVQHLNTASAPPYAVNYISYGVVGVCTLGLTAGHVLRILVGQQGTRGQSGTFARCGGCGGSFVYNETTATLLLSAGGGGGHGGDPGGATLGSGTSGDPYRNGTGKGDDGQIGTSGSVGRDGNGGTAGVNGAGGGANTQGYGGDGGAGFNGNGNVNTANGNSVTAAKSFNNGGNGAIGGNSPGGFGGGGSGGSNGGAGAGGGGGYSGGGGGANQGNGEGGGGGGSFTVGTFTSSSATNLGMGYVIVAR